MYRVPPRHHRMSPHPHPSSSVPHRRLCLHGVTVTVTVKLAAVTEGKKREEDGTLCSRAQAVQGDIIAPRVGAFSFDEVNEAAGRERKPQIPDQGKGVFMIVTSTNELQVAVFRYDKTTGCSTPSDAHNLLPMPNCRHRMTEMLMREMLMRKTDIRVGCRFLYNGHDQQYTIDDKGDININSHVECFPPPEPFQCEIIRSSQMIQGLKLALGEHYTVAHQGGNFSHHCRFSGGGDLSIFKSTCSAAVVVLHPNDGTDDGIPPDDDIRDISLNTKVSPTKPNTVSINLGSELDQETYCRNVTLQLQADMFLLCSTLFINKIEECPDKAEGINILSCYRLQIGLNCPLKILKLSVDFSKKKHGIRRIIEHTTKSSSSHICRYGIAACRFLFVNIFIPPILMYVRCLSV